MRPLDSFDFFKANLLEYLHLLWKKYSAVTDMNEESIEKEDRIRSTPGHFGDTIETGMCLLWNLRSLGKGRKQLDEIT